MAEDTLREVSSSSRRSDGPDRHHQRHRESSRRHRDDGDDGSRKHSSRSSHSDRGRKDEERHRSRDDDRHQHRSSHHHSSRGPDRRREREDEEERRERKRRHREDEADGRRRHESGSRHSRHQHERAESRHSPTSHRHSHRDKGDATTRDKQPATDFIPTSESLSLTSDPTSDQATDDSSKLKRDDWMTGGFGGDADFSSLGKPRVKPPRPEKPDPEQLQISSRELNTQLRQGKTVDEYETPTDADAPQFGAPGYQWRMMKLKRTIEAAESEGRRLEEVALERYASLEDFERAREEKSFLDGKGGPKEKVGEAGRSTPTLQSVARRSYLLASAGAGGGDASSRSGTASGDSSRPGSRQAFRRPGESSKPSTPTPAPAKAPRNIGFETPSSTPAMPTAIPNVFTPVIQRPTHSQPPNGIVLDDGSSDPDRPILTADQLNKLQAKIMQAELMGSTNLDTLRAEYDSEKARAEAHRSAGDRGGAFGATSGDTKDETVTVLQDGDRQLQVLPTLDARGRMYDVGSSTGVESTSGVHSDSKRKARKASALDNEDDSSLTLSDLVRQERFSAGPSSLKNIDATLATSIMTDTHFSADLGEQDNSASRYASSRKANADALKRQFAINDFARTQRALEKCRFCFRNQGSSPPRVALISSGYRAYLCIPDKEAVAGEEDHVQIVPMQHHLSLLEADDDTWEEMRNFQKCLAQLASSQGKIVVFYETLVSIKAQQHAVMEAILLKNEVMDRLPGVFKESLREVGGEWSTHRKVIEFSPEKSFRRALVPQLPYFAVTWDYKWSTGYGHIIENPTGGTEGKEEANAYDVEEMAAGGGTGARGRFDPNFARDVIRGVLEDLDADDDDGYVRSFGRDKVRSEGEKQRIKQVFKKGWDKVDWTKMLENGGCS